MKGLFSKMSAIVLATIILVCAVLPTTTAYADTNVTIVCKDAVMYELLTKSLEKSYTLVSKDDANLTFVMSKTDVENVKSISLSYSNATVKPGIIGDISGIEYFTNLSSLSITNTLVNTGKASAGSFTDLSPVKNLSNLRTLSLNGTLATDFSPIAGLTGLKTLSLEGAEDIDLSQIDKLSNLTDLYLSTCGVDDAEFAKICNISSLTYLSLGGPNYEKNNVTNIAPITKLTNLQTLKLDNNQITDISPLTSLTKLIDLSLRCNPVTDISPLSSMTQLRGLRLGRDGYAGSNEGLPIEGKIDALKNLTGLYTLEISHCGLTDISALSGLTKLSTLDLSSNSIVDFSPVLPLNISHIQLDNQSYTQNVNGGDTVALPQSIVSALTDSSSALYSDDLEAKTNGCVLSADKKSVTIDEGVTSASISLSHKSYSYDAFSAKVSYKVNDVVAPKLTVNYSTTALTNGNVTVIIEANESVKDIAGFNKVNSKKFTKEFSENVDTKIDVYDLAGNKSVATVKIANIDKVAPTVNVKYSTTDTTYDAVTVTIEANEAIKDIDGFTKVDDKTFTKSYAKNAKESITVFDLAGNKATAIVTVANITTKPAEDPKPVTPDPQPETKPEVKPEVKPVATGDNTMISLYAVLLLVSAGTIVVARKRKEN